MTETMLTKRIAHVRPILVLNRRFSHKARRRVMQVCALVLLFALFFSLENGLFGLPPQFGYGLFFMAAGVWLLVFMTDMYIKHFYFSGIGDGQEKQKKDFETMTYEWADIVFSMKETDVAYGLFFSEQGKERAARLGISYADIESFFLHRAQPVPLHQFTYDQKGYDVSHMARRIIEQDEELRDFCAGFGVVPETFVHACAWVSRRDAKRKQEERWWSRASLGRIPSIGTEWSLGFVPTLSSVAQPIESYPGYADVSETTASLYGDAVTELEHVLGRSRYANAVMVGTRAGEMIKPVMLLNTRIQHGTVYSELEHKRLYILSCDHLVGETDSAQEIEALLTRIFREAARAEEVVIVIPHIAGCIRALDTYGIDIIEFMRPYISSPVVQIIALATRQEYESSVRSKTGSLCDEVVLSDDATDVSLRRVIMHEIERVESAEDVLFTYRSVEALARAVSRLFTSAEHVSRIQTLVPELAHVVQKAGRQLVIPEDVDSVLSVKTGVPGKAVSEKEKTKLLELEDLLHKRVVGQNEAIRAIGDALRRSRSGIGSPRRPMGSFLFLGPTGVGKTETARSLAAVFFESEDNMIRFDMTEYSGADALSRLIGDFATGKPGVLVSRLRERPYGIVLLDEFEKAHSTVHDLFLQILDEGKFADMRGEEVNARNAMIIATSNAASDLIWNLMQEKHAAHMREQVIDYMVERNIFKPELLNRFDGIVAFHPLEKTHIGKVAERMLEKLARRLKGQGYHLSYTKDLVDRLVEIGSDPKFGARPIARAINERVEGAIARRILEGKVKAGDMVEISAADLV